MNVQSDPIAWYGANAATLAPEYESIDSARLYAWLDGMLPAGRALVLDIGAGTGRDAAWLARLGHDVIAVEPSSAMRAEGQRRHVNAPVTWLSDKLPALPATFRLGLAFELILVSAVWQHIPPSERERALRKMLGLLRPGGLLVLTLRHGPEEAERGISPVSLTEVERLARTQGALVARVADLSDQMGRSEVFWTGVVLRLPDDGTGALPLLRHIILNDQKTATYKLGLLRALCRAADSQGGMAEDREEEIVVLPLGLIALNWVRLYLPLITAGLPQAPRNAGADGLGFAGPGFRAILSGLVSRPDLRVGARFAGEAAQALRAALQEAADLIVRMPAHYMTYSNGGPILVATRQRASLTLGEVVLDQQFLIQFGTIVMPREFWRALGRFAGNCSPLDYEVSKVGSGRMISRIARRADFPMSRPVAMTEAAAA